MSGIAEDLRFSIRLMARHPAFTCVVVITLALGIGANSAIFSIVNSFILRPLPFDNPEELVYLGEYYRDGEHPGVTSWVNFTDFRDQSTAFEDMAAWWSDVVNLSGRGEPFRVNAAIVSPNYFSLLGLRPLLGAGFSAGGVIEENRVVVLSERLWRSRFGADPEVIGTSLTLDGQSFSVAGVMPTDRRASALDLGEPVLLWRAVSLDDLGVYATVRGARWAHVVARLAPGTSLEQARGELSAISGRFAAEYPDANRNWTTRAVPLHDYLVRDAKLSLLVLLGAVALVLLIACANVANLQLARAASRRQEIAMRSALGAGWGRIVRQMLTESLLLSLLGGAIGLVLAVVGLKVPQAVSPGGSLPLSVIRIDASVLLFTLALSMVTGLVFGLAPAALTASSSLTQFLRAGSRELSTSAGRGRLRRGLVVAEVALALMLLVGAGLLIKSFTALQRVDPGFRTDRVLTFKLSLPETRYPEPFQRAEFFRELMEKITVLPGVEAAGAESNLPMASDMGDRGFRIQGRPEPGPDETLVVDYSRATPDYFRTMGVPLTSGRYFSDSDTADTAPVVVVNRTMAERYWSLEDPVGSRIKLLGAAGDQPEWRTIVGVVGDVRHAGLDVPVAPRVYLPHTQDPYQSMAIAVRTAGDPLSVVASLRHVIQTIDADQPIAEVRTMEQVVSEAAAPRRLVIVLLVSFAVVAVALAAVGIYGVISYSVSQRMHEFGLRMALGADRLEVVTLVVRQGLATTLLGVVVGVIGALGAARMAANLLFETSPADPVVLCTVSAMLAAVALAACCVPAYRASRLDPMVALRYQ